MNTENLIEFRKDLGLTQEDIGKLIGVDRSTYACYENGIANISIEHLNIISNQYYKSLNFLSGHSRSDNVIFKEKEINLTDIGKILKRERKRNNMTQKQLASKINVVRQRISKYEHGEGITIPVLIEYAKIFNKSIDYLCGKADK